MRKATIATLAAFALLTPAAPVTASAATPRDDAVASVRSFPKRSKVRRDPLAESTSVNVNGDWGGIETLDVPQTQSQAEKDAEAQRKAQAEQSARQAQAQAQSQVETSRNETRTAIITPPATQTGQAVADYSLQFKGYPYVYGGNQPSGWDCSGFVQYVFAQFGVTLPHSSGAQMSVGSPVASLAQAQPGDILANTSHAAIYVGNGMVMNAMSPSQGTGIAAVSTVMHGSYTIRRVMQ